MNFSDFQKRRQQLLAERPGLQDCAESNVYRALSGLFKDLPVADDPITETMHRCHLAEQWTEHFALPASASTRALVSCGVRHSLELIFKKGSENGDRFWLPKDNYPVYHELAAKAGAMVSSFPTLPEPVWPDADRGDDEVDEFLLITNPLKPRGRWLSDGDVSKIEEWLSGGERRRLIIDAVYDLGKTFYAGTLRLLAGEKTILLHSLTKGWLHPRLFGVALVPEQDREKWLPTFRAADPLQENLAMARELMGEHAAMPGRVAVTLAAAGDALFYNLPVNDECCLATDAPGYLFPIRKPWHELLAAGILGLPASVFGSDNESLTILSSLHLVR